MNMSGIYNVDCMPAFRVLIEDNSIDLVVTDPPYKIISGGTENHCMLIDLRNKNITGKDAENALVKADITANKNMVPFDTQSPFITSGIRVGTPAITTRGVKENTIPTIVNLIDKVIMNYEDENVLSEVRKEVNKLMSTYPIFA